MISRRKFLLTATAGLATLCTPHAFARTGQPGERSLRFYNLHTGEKLHATYWAGGEYIQDELAAINTLLRDGQEIMVQVAKDPLGTKGARLTTHISIPARYLVYMPGSRHVGVSQRIEDEAERERLKTIVREFAEQNAPGGFIVRTAGEGVNQE